ncbi:MAG: hypothetical protein IPL08_03370 [Saprospiraceae bacterium]|nr:hypothetical protein [Saprospiraceae bacterium]
MLFNRLAPNPTPCPAKSENKLHISLLFSPRPIPISAIDDLMLQGQ